MNCTEDMTGDPLNRMNIPEGAINDCFDRSTIGGLQDELKCRCEEHISASPELTESEEAAIRKFVKYACAMYGVSK